MDRREEERRESEMPCGTAPHRAPCTVCPAGVGPGFTRPSAAPHRTDTYDDQSFPYLSLINDAFHSFTGDERARGAAWRGVAWRGVSWRGAGSVRHCALIRQAKERSLRAPKEPQRQGEGDGALRSDGSAQPWPHFFSLLMTNDSGRLWL